MNYVKFSFNFQSEILIDKQLLTGSKDCNLQTNCISSALIPRTLPADSRHGGHYKASLTSFYSIKIQSRTQ